jgi:hypothetical protein
MKRLVNVTYEMNDERKSLLIRDFLITGIVGRRLR